jgi:hypothetical protein
MASDKITSFVLYNSDFHKKIVHVEEEELSIVDAIHKSDLYEYPLERGKFNLLDLNTKDLVAQFDRIGDVNLSDYPTEEICYYGIYPNSLASTKIPSVTTSLQIQSSDGLTFLWYNDIRLNNLWAKLRYEVESFNFLKNPTREESDSFESEMRSLYNIEIPKLKIDSQINKLINEIAESNVNTLSISHIYLSGEDLKSLSNLKKLTELKLLYNYNDNILWLPSNLNRLKVYGSTIQKISQINFKNLKVVDLSLEGNCINDLSDITVLPKSVNYLNLISNRISHFSIKKLPINLETLWLKGNLIDNSFFEGINKDAENETVKFLSLSYNQLKINNWLLKRIIETFPMLEHLELEGNVTEGIDDSILINDDEFSCIKSIKAYLANEEYKNDGNFDDFESSFNYYRKNHKLSIKWRHESLPVGEILAGIDCLFKEYLKEMTPELICFSDGLYCNFPHNETSMLIRGCSQQEKSIEFNLFALNDVTFEKYFYKYFIEINRIISLNTHHYILPVVNFPKESNEFHLFYKKVFNLNEVINKIPIVDLEEGTPQLLVRKLTKRPLVELQKKSNESEKIKSSMYKDIKNIAFVIDSDPNLYPYFIDENFSISNIEEDNKRHKDEEFYRISADSKERGTYSKCLKNKYLGNHCFQEGILHLGTGKTVGPIIYFNTRYFKKDGTDIVCIQSETKINYECLAHYKKNDKFFKLKIVDCKIVASYEKLK